MSIKTIDVFVFIPLIPAIPVLATWFLPWERWIPRKLPNKILGPYLLYCSFGCWYFKGPWWVIVLVASLGVGSCVMAVLDLRKTRRLAQSRNWPTADGHVIGVSENQDNDRFVRVTLVFNYKVNGDRYGGSEVFEFKNEQEASRFKEQHREKVTVNYQPDKPEIYVLLHESTP